jgi:ribose transport system permease protein
MQSEYFFTVGNFKSVGLAMSISATMAFAQTVVLISGGLDLSFTGVLALAGIAGQKAFDAGAPLSLILLAGLGVGLGAGLCNAALIVGLGVNALIATVGTQFMFYGTAYIWTSGQGGSYFSGTSFNYLGSGKPFGIPFPVLIMVGVFAVIGFSMKFCRFGSRVYAVGGSEDATRLAGVPVWRLRTTVYVVSGLCAALCGIVVTGLDGAAYPNTYMGEELIVIAAVILGGTALSGGRGTVSGTLLGAILLAVVANGLNLLGVQSYWQRFVEGAILIVAVTSDAVRRRARSHL